MNERTHATDHSHEPEKHNAEIPGRRSASAALRSSDAPMASGILARKADGAAVADDAEQMVGAASSSSGHGLPDDLRSRFESSLGADLSGVRIHTGEESQAAASSVGALAYATGNDIHFGAGQYDPGSVSGQHLIAHEVAHTVQQSGGSATRQNKLEVSGASDSFELEADCAAVAMVAGQAFSLNTTTPTVARKPAGAAPDAKADDKVAAELDPFIPVLDAAASNASKLHAAVLDNVDTCTDILDQIGEAYAGADAAYKEAYEKHVSVVTQQNTPPVNGVGEVIAEMVAGAIFSAVFPKASALISILSNVAAVATAGDNGKAAEAKPAPVENPDSIMVQHLKQVAKAQREVGLSSSKAGSLHRLSSDAKDLQLEIERVKDGKGSKSPDAIKKRAGELSTASDQAKGVSAQISGMQSALIKSYAQVLNPRNFDAKWHERTIWMKWISNIPKESLQVTLQDNNTSVIRYYLVNEGIIAPDDNLLDYNSKPGQIQADANWALQAQSYLNKSGVAETDLAPSGGINIGGETVPATRVGETPISAGTTVAVVNVAVGGLGAAPGIKGSRPEPVIIYVRAVSPDRED